MPLGSNPGGPRDGCIDRTGNWGKRRHDGGGGGAWRKGRKRPWVTDDARVPDVVL